jgi:hypothetical protein
MQLSLQDDAAIRIDARKTNESKTVMIEKLADFLLLCLGNILSL